MKGEGAGLRHRDRLINALQAMMEGFDVVTVGGHQGTPTSS